jgi:signal transduction histidine kinase
VSVSGASGAAPPASSEERLRRAIDAIADELCFAVDGKFDFTVAAPIADPLVEKLGMLVNFVLDAARRALHQLEEQNAKLAELDRLKSDFLANVSHELRTPLTLILGPLETLLAGETGPLPRPAVERLERVQRNAARLKGLVDDLLDFAKLEAGKLEVSWQAVASASSSWRSWRMRVRPPRRGSSRSSPTARRTSAPSRSTGGCSRRSS